MASPRVSVVVPTRNRRALVERALDCVLAQDGVEVEVIVVDDASDDDTPTWLASVDERVVVVRNDERLGVAATRNVGLEHATSPWVAFVDDDDLWSPQKLAAQLEAASAGGADWALAGAVVLNGDLEIRAAQHVVPPDRFLPLLLGHNVVPGGASGVLARTELVRRVGGFDTRLRIMADWDLWIRLALTGPPAGVDRPLVGYVLHGANMTSAPRGFREELALVCEKHADAQAAHGVRPNDLAWTEWLAEVQRRSGRRVAPAREQLGMAVRGRRPRAILRAAAIVAHPRWAERRDRWRLDRIAPAWLAEAEEWLAPLRARHARAHDRRPRAKVFVVSLDEPLRPLEVGPGYFKVVLLVRAGRAVLGHVSLPALELLTVAMQRAAIAEQLAGPIWRRDVARVLRGALGIDGPRAAAAQPTVSVIVCTRDRPDDLERCLASLGRLATRPHEILVVDNAPTDARTREVCERHAVRYVLEPTPGQSRARNRGIAESTGEIVAFTDDDCTVDPGWLDDLHAELDDPLVLAVTGYVGPAELDEPAQLLFEAQGGFGRGFRRRVFDGTRVNAAQAAGLVGAGANAIFRRSTFATVGAFAEDLGPGTPARAADDNDMFCRILDAGYRIAFDPSRVVWHRHRRDDESLRTLLRDYGISSSAFVARRVGRHHDLGALRILAWWWLDHFPKALVPVVMRRPTRLPLGVVLGEVGGTLAGPWRLAKSKRSRRGIAEVAIPTPPAPAERTPVSVVAEWPSLSVLVPTRNRSSILRTMLDALGQSRYPAERLQAVVVLDGSTDDSAEVVRSADVPYRLTWIETEPRGVSAARNRGIEVATEPVVLMLDDDTTPEPGCLAAHAALHARGETDVVLGYCPPIVGDGWFETVLRAWWEDHYRHKRQPRHRWTYSDFVTGNASVPRVLLESVGGFDEAFTARRDDWELGIRLLGRGTRFAYCHEAVAPHSLNTSLETAIARQREEGAVDVLLARRHPEAFGQLPLARFETLPQVEAPNVGRALRAAARLERVGLRALWSRRVLGLFRTAYALGVVDEVRTSAAFAELRAAAPAPIRIPLSLDGGSPPELPSLGRLLFVLESEGRTVAEVEPVHPGQPWDWVAVVERLDREAGRELRGALLRRELAADRGAAEASSSAPRSASA